MTPMTFQGFLCLSTCFPRTPPPVNFSFLRMSGRAAWSHGNRLDGVWEKTTEQVSLHQRLWHLKTSQSTQLAQCQMNTCEPRIAAPGGVIKLLENLNCQMTGSQTESCHYCLHSNWIILLEICLRHVHLWKWCRRIRPFKHINKDELN